MKIKIPIDPNPIKNKPPIVIYSTKKFVFKQF